MKRLESCRFSLHKRSEDVLRDTFFFCPAARPLGFVIHFLLARLAVSCLLHPEMEPLSPRVLMFIPRYLYTIYTTNSHGYLHVEAKNINEYNLST